MIAEERFVKIQRWVLPSASGALDPLCSPSWPLRKMSLPSCSPSCPRVIPSSCLRRNLASCFPRGQVPTHRGHPCMYTLYNIHTYVTLHIITHYTTLHIVCALRWHPPCASNEGGSLGLSHVTKWLLVQGREDQNPAKKVKRLYLCIPELLADFSNQGPSAPPVPIPNPKPQASLRSVSSRLGGPGLRGTSVAHVRHIRWQQLGLFSGA